jgi:hypothetical protein
VYGDAEADSSPEKKTENGLERRRNCPQGVQQQLVDSNGQYDEATVKVAFLDTHDIVQTLCTLLFASFSCQMCCGNFERFGKVLDVGFQGAHETNRGPHRLNAVQTYSYEHRTLPTALYAQFVNGRTLSACAQQI